MTPDEIQAFRSAFPYLRPEMEEALAFVSRPLEEQARVTNAIDFVSAWLVRRALPGEPQAMHREQLIHTGQYL